MSIKLGTRASALARWQAEWVAAQLRNLGANVELVPITTAGDQQQLTTINSIGGQGVFTKEIQRALLDGRIDLAVHSLKDLPTGETAGLQLSAIPQRGPTADVIATNKGAGSLCSVSDLPSQARVGTGSLRRRAQLLHCRLDLQIQNVRGNVETRLRKLEQGDFDAIVLAEAGLRRLGLERHISFVLPRAVMLPAVGQGALAIETRTDDATARELAAALDHSPTRAAVLAEREMLSTLQGGCLAPIAALAQTEGPRLTLIGRVVSKDGAELLETVETISLSSAFGDAPISESDEFASRELGRRAAEKLLEKGAAALIAAARESDG